MDGDEDIQLNGFKPNTRARVVTAELAGFVREVVPARLSSHGEWTLRYSLEQDGSSLRTLYERARPARSGEHSGYVLAIRDAAGGVFGAFLNEHPRPSETTRYYGNGDCLLWKQAAPAPGAAAAYQAFPYTGENDFVIFSTPKFLSLGGGDGHYGLWVDDDLLAGVSEASPTFANEPLSAQGTKFQIVALELWQI